MAVNVTEQERTLPSKVLTSQAVEAVWMSAYTQKYITSPLSIYVFVIFNITSYLIHKIKYLI